MYPKDCCKIQPSVATTFQLITIILCNLIIISWPLTPFEAMNLTISHIISFHSFPCSCIDYCFLQISPATTIEKLISLEYDKMKINLKLNKIKLTV